jgi:hypothetical protein
VPPRILSVQREGLALCVDSGEVGGADDSGVVYELGDGELRLWVKATSRQMRKERFANGLEQDIACHRDSPAEYKHLGIEHGGEARTGRAEPSTEFAQRLERSRIAGRDEFAHLATRELARDLARVGEPKPDATDVGNGVGHPEQGASRSVLLDAAAGTATAREAIRHNTQMTDLCPGTESSAEQAILCDDRTPNAGAEREHRHVAVEAASPVAEFGPPRGVGVVVDRDVDLESVEQALPKRFVSPVDIGRVVHRGLRGVDEAGRGDPCGDNVPPRGEPADHLDDRVDDGIRIAGRSRTALLLQDYALVVDNRSRDLRSADVYPDRLHERQHY